MSRRSWLSFGALGAGLLVSSPLASQAPETLRFCAAQHNLPMSAAHPPGGVEVDVAHALAEHLGARAELVWREADEEGVEQGILDGACDAALGSLMGSGGMAGGELPNGLVHSSPYYAAGYALIHRSNSATARSLTELDDARIAVEAESIPVYTLKQRGHPIHAFFDYDAVVGAVAEGRIRYGYLWAPVAARLLAGRNDVVIAPDFDPSDRWDFALAVRETDFLLRESLNEALEELVRVGSVAEIFRRHGVPHLNPSGDQTCTCLVE